MGKLLRGGLLRLLEELGVLLWRAEGLTWMAHHSLLNASQDMENPNSHRHGSTKRKGTLTLKDFLGYSSNDPKDGETP